jgi:superfamily II DNA or RNA helicase
MTLRDYQNEAVLFLLPRKRGFIVAPAGSGKTIIAARAAALVAALVATGRSVLHSGPVALVWIANTREQVEQAEKALSATPCSAPVDITVCCAAALPDLSKADIVIVDEAHHMPAETWAATIERTPLDAVLWGFSATPYGEDDERNTLLDGTFQEFFFIARHRVEESGHLIKGKVFMHDLDPPGCYDAEIKARTTMEVRRRCVVFPRVAPFEHQRRAQWQITQETVQQNSARNLSACHLARTLAAAGESVLILVHSIEHGEKLAAQLDGSACVHSKLPKKKRRESIESLRDGSRKILIATSLADEGLDVPRASRLILVAGGRSAGKLEQRAGRVLRPFEGKNGGEIHDFLDRGALFAHQQAKARMRVYEQLGYAPEIKSYL